MIFPYDFGFVPSTKAEDGDPLDVLVLTDAPLFPGCSVDCRLVGAIEMEQEAEGEKNRNDRLLAVATQSLLYSQTHNISDVNPTVLKQIEDFFVNYQRVRNIKVKILGNGDRIAPSRFSDVPPPTGVLPEPASIIGISSSHARKPAI